MSTGTGRSSALLLTVTSTAAPCADRVVFAFDMKHGGTPSCRVSYQRGPFTEDASGKRVTVAGSAFVVVRCSPAYGYDFETARITYSGPKRIDPTDTHRVREAVETGDNEGVLTWVIGLDAQRPFAVQALGGPPGVAGLAIAFS